MAGHHPQDRSICSSAASARVLTAPLVALLAVAVRLESPGETPFIRKTRVGRDGELFEIYKLRTMVDGAEHHGAGLAISAGEQPHHPAGEAAAPDLAR